MLCVVTSRIVWENDGDSQPLPGLVGWPLPTIVLWNSGLLRTGCRTWRSDFQWVLDHLDGMYSITVIV